jgi:demethylmenaquinone methyltransferase/2-methoxy-6-polyprenyl-1,4-benzoquinol methylase
MEIIDEPHYADYITAHNNFMQPALKEIIGIFSPPPGSKGLDAGCGTGDLFELLAEKTTADGKVLAGDLSRDHLKKAAERAANIKSIQMMMEPLDMSLPLPFDSDEFDWVWCGGVLWSSSFMDPLAVVKEFARITRPGGRIAIFWNGWQRTLLLPGHRHLEFELVRVSDLILRPAKSTDPKVDFEYMAGWLKEAGLVNINVSAHTVSYSWPLPDQAKPYIDSVLSEDYLAALEVSSYSETEKENIRPLLTPGHANYIPDQTHYFCCKTGVLAMGQVNQI